MKNCLIVIQLFFIFNNHSFSQNRQNVWCFGDSCLINFNTNPPSTNHSVLRSRGTSCSIADSSGSLLFYAGSPHVELWQSGGTFFIGSIYNKSHQIMDNGDTLATEGWYNEMIIIPDPNFNNSYYLFHLHMTTTDTGLFYSKIDLSYNSGLGRVTTKNNKLLAGYMADGVAAIKHGNGRDWWVLCRKTDALIGGPPNNDFYIYLIDTSGITPQPIQSIGTLNPTNLAKITFNPLGDKFVFTNLNDLIEMYDFDRCTGIISNPVTIEPNASPGNYHYLWSAEFSGSGRYLYVSTSIDTSFIYQYDTYASNITSTKIPINSFTQIYNAGGALKRGPDGKIYYAMAWSDGVNYNFPYPDTEYNVVNMNLGVINQPDSPGVACDFQPFSFYLGGKRNYWGLPNNPDYDLQQLHGSSCDTLHVKIDEVSKEKDDLQVYPNPTNGTITIHSEKYLNGEIRITDAIGKSIRSVELTNGRIVIENLNPGIYTLGLFENGILQTIKKIIVVK